MTPRLKRLEAAGLVARGRVPTDARAVLINITEEGTRALESVHAARREILKQAVKGIDASSLTTTAEVLSLLTERLASEPFTIEQRP
ncbi:hypothetical protein LRP67_03300 [Nocardioides sp. cx-169]|nr:hypothetical protein [Nocardioides sp. cx-169]